MKGLFVAVLMMFVVSSAFGFTSVYEGNMSSATYSVGQNFDLLLPAVDKLSIQATYFPVSPAAVSFIDGVRSSGTITVGTNTGLSGSTITINGTQYVEGIEWNVGNVSSNTATSIYNIVSSTYGVRATGTLTVSTTYSLTNSSFTLYGTNFKEGVSWFVSNSAANTAESIRAALSSYYAGTLAITRTNSTVYLSYYTLGHIGNGSFSSNTTSITVSGMTGGLNVGSGNIIDFSKGSTSSIIYATSTAVGVGGNYTLASTVSSSITVAGMTGGVAADIDYVADKIVKTNTFPLGMALLYTISSGNTPTGLTANTTYYAIPSSDGASFKLATTQANASAGITIDIKKVAADNNGSFTLTPLAIASGYGVILYLSNDGANWTALSVSSITYSSAGSTYWDLGTYNFKYIRAAFTAGVSGAIKLILRYFGKY